MAQARGYYRGPSQSQIKAMQAYQKQIQQEMELMAKQEEAESRAFMSKFDTNGDGQLTGKEKAPAEKFLRERRLGKAGPLAGPVSLDPTSGKGRPAAKPNKK